MESAQAPFLVKPVIPSRLVHPYDGSVIPSIHSLVREHFTMTARFRFLLHRIGSFLTSHPALWIDVQSLPQGCHFLMPIHQVRTCTSHQQISCVAVNLQPAHPHALRMFRANESHWPKDGRQISVVPNGGKSIISKENVSHDK